MRHGELIERLRRNAEYQREKGWGNDGLLRQAADVIERLVEEVARYDYESVSDDRQG